MNATPETSGVRGLDVLLIEDQPHDVELIELALQRARVRHVLHVIPDGRDALDYLEGKELYHGAPRPDLVILDLSLLGAHRLEVLSRIKGDEDLRTIPVVVLTGSREAVDVWRSDHAHANAYSVTPAKLCPAPRARHVATNPVLRAASVRSA